MIKKNSPATRMRKGERKIKKEKENEQKKTQQTVLMVWLGHALLQVKKFSSRFLASWPSFWMELLVRFQWIDINHVEMHRASGTKP